MRGSQGALYGFELDVFLVVSFIGVDGILVSDMFMTLSQESWGSEMA